MIQELRFTHYISLSYDIALYIRKPGIPSEGSVVFVHRFFFVCVYFIFTYLKNPPSDSANRCRSFIWIYCNHYTTETSPMWNVYKQKTLYYTCRSQLALRLGAAHAEHIETVEKVLFISPFTPLRIRTCMHSNIHVQLWFYFLFSVVSFFFWSFSSLSPGLGFIHWGQGGPTTNKNTASETHSYRQSFTTYK